MVVCWFLGKKLPFQDPPSLKFHNRTDTNVHERFCSPVCWKAGAAEIPTLNQVQSIGLQKCVVIDWNIMSKFKLIYSFSCSHKIPSEWKLQLLFSRFSPNWLANSKVLDTSAGTTELNHFRMNSNSTAIKGTKNLPKVQKTYLKIFFVYVFLLFLHFCPNNMNLLAKLIPNWLQFILFTDL